MSAWRDSVRRVQYSSDSSSEMGSATLPNHPPDAFGGFGILLKKGVSERLESQGQTIFFVAKVDKDGPAYTAGVRADDTLVEVDGHRVKTWEDAAKLLLGGVGTSAAVRWHSKKTGQHKSARIRRAAASPFDLEILVVQQKERRESKRETTQKGVFSQASAGWNWLKKQAGKHGSSKNQHSMHLDDVNISERGSKRGNEQRRDSREGEPGAEGHGRMPQNSEGGQPPSPLTQNSLAMWTDSWQKGREGAGGMGSHERVVMNGYLRHAVDLAREGSARGNESLPAPLLVMPEDSRQSVLTSVNGSAWGESGESGNSGLEDDGDSETDSRRGGWKKKVKKALNTVVKEVSVVMGAEKSKAPQLSRSTLHGKSAGVGVSLVAGAKGTVVVGHVAPWIWAGKHGLAFPLSVGDIVTHIDKKRLPHGITPTGAHEERMRMLTYADVC